MRTAPRVFTVVLTLVLLAGCDDALDSRPDGPGPANAGNSKVTLNSLKVAEWQSMSGYSRDRFPHWRQVGSNCNVRDTVLERDGKSIKKSGCNITDGTWESAYDGLTLTDPLKVDVDHMVPLANAWRSGANSWNDDKRADFANDVDRPQLRAVSASSNRSKGDQDPSQWRPDVEEFWCQYAQEWITVKSYWELSVTASEKAALTDMLATCA